MATLSRQATIISWIAQLIGIVILGMAGVMKLIGAADPVAMFTHLGAEPWGRYLLGAVEITAVVLLVRPATAARGAALAALLMVGAILAHLTKLGIVYNDDGGTLFGMAVLVLIASLVILRLRKDELTG